MRSAGQGFGSFRLETLWILQMETGLESPLSICKMRESGAQSPNSLAQTFLDVPSRAFPDSRQGLYSKSKQIPFVLPSREWGGTWEPAGHGGCWRSLSPSCPLLCCMQEAQSARAHIPSGDQHYSLSRHPHLASPSSFDTLPSLPWSLRYCRQVGGGGENAGLG